MNNELTDTSYASMDSKLVCCSSGVNAKLLSEKLASISCIYDSNMNLKTVNVLIVGKVGSTKHICALNNGIPCVTVSVLIIDV